MEREKFINYLENNSCVVVRHDNSGYSIMRNVINLQMSGIPKNNPKTGKLRPATMCRVCITLGVDIPEGATESISIIDAIHNHRNGNTIN